MGNKGNMAVQGFLVVNPYVEAITLLAAAPPILV